LRLRHARLRVDKLGRHQAGALQQRLGLDAVLAHLRHEGTHAQHAVRRGLLAKAIRAFSCRQIHRVFTSFGTVGVF
jgi:hypothetical protein